MENLYKPLLPLAFIATFLFLVYLVLRFVAPKWLEWRVLKRIRTVPFIEIIEEDSFLIHTPRANNVQTVKWSDVKSANLADNNKELVLNMEDNTSIVFNYNKYRSWEELIRAIPSNINVNDNLKNFRNANYSNMACCKICGKIAVKNSKCWVCLNETYEKYNSEFTKLHKNKKSISEHEYIVEKQLLHFDTDESDNVDFYYKNILFENCNSWEPLVTEEEVKSFWNYANNDL